MDCSDKKLRTLGEALQTDRFSAEALAFVNGAAGNPAKKVLPAPNTAPTAPDPKPANTNGVLIEPPPESPTPITGTVSMTFRLPAALSTRLIRASVERKLKRERPFSQQDIITQALAQWLERNS